MIDEDFLLIPLYAHDEKGYDAAYTNKYEKVFDIKNKKYNEEQLTSFEHHWKNAYPNCYLNDIAGYAILYVHDKDIMIKYYLNGDKRKIYNHDYVHLQQYNKQLFRDIGYRQGAVNKCLITLSHTKSPASSQWQYQGIPLLSPLPAYSSAPVRVSCYNLR